MTTHAATICHRCADSTTDLYEHLRFKHSESEAKARREAKEYAPTGAGNGVVPMDAAAVVARVKKRTRAPSSEVGKCRVCKRTDGTHAENCEKITGEGCRFCLKLGEPCRHHGGDSLPGKVYEVRHVIHQLERKIVKLQRAVAALKEVDE